MCTLVVAVRRWPGLPLLVAANRDERFDRPAAPPRLWERNPVHGEGPPLFAPEDLRAGGTWLGLNDRGVFAAITNRWPTELDPARRSRGLIVLDALAGRSAEAGADAVAAHGPTAHNAFHLVVADEEGAHLVWSDAARMRRERLLPGVHVITEQSLQGVPVPREERVRRSGLFDGPGPPARAALQELLGSRGSEAFDGLCVRYEPMNYGTRSSTLFEVRASGERSMHIADGPPDRTPWVPVRLPF